MRAYYKLKLSIIDIIISLNVFSLYLVESFQPKDSHFNIEMRISESLGVLLILETISLISISVLIPNFNWKVYLFFIYGSNLVISLIFKRRICKKVEVFSQTIYRKYYFIYLFFIIISFPLFLYMYFLL